MTGTAWKHKKLGPAFPLFRGIMDVYRVTHPTRGARKVERERRITTRAPESLHRAVRVKAAELGRPVSEVVRALLEM